MSEPKTERDAEITFKNNDDGDRKQMYKDGGLVAETNLLLGDNALNQVKRELDSISLPVKFTIIDNPHGTDGYRWVYYLNGRVKFYSTLVFDYPYEAYDNAIDVFVAEF